MKHALDCRALLLLVALLMGMGTANAAKSAAESEENAALTARVKAALIADETTKARRINIETHRGIVQLSGFVGTNEEKMHAERLAASVPGVLEVRNALEIRPQLADRGLSNGTDDAVKVRHVRNGLQVEPMR